MIRARGLSRRFGDKRVLERLDLDLEDGGFLVVTGANGSGKTTLLRLCAGLLAPTGGDLRVETDRGRIGFLAHEPLVYRELTALENLDLYGRLYRIPERRERTGMLLERFGLWNSVFVRFNRWAKSGVWHHVFRALQDPDLEALLLDSTVIRAHQHAAGSPEKKSRARKPSAARAAASAPSCISR